MIWVFYAEKRREFRAENVQYVLNEIEMNGLGQMVFCVWGRRERVCVSLSVKIEMKIEMNEESKSEAKAEFLNS